MEVFRGNYKDIGHQIGEYYLKNKTGITETRINIELLNKQINVYKKYYPEKLIQLEAIAESAGYDKQSFLYKNICGEIWWYRNFVEGKGCTIFGVANEDGVYVGRNYDWKPGTEKAFQVFKSVNSDCYSYIGITDMDYASKLDLMRHHLFYDIDDAINDQGLYIGLTFAYNNKWSYGISPVHINQLIAEKCKTVGEALAIFEKTPVAVPKNFFIADKNGNMCVIEHTAKRYKILEPINGILIQTNHYINPELAREDTINKRSPLNNTFKRYAEALEKLTEKKDQIHQIGVEKILNCPNSEILENHKKMKTIWSLALDMKRQKYRLYWNLLEGKEEELLEFEKKVVK